MNGRSPFLQTDAFQSVVYTSAGTIDVIATDQAASRRRAEGVAAGLAWALQALGRLLRGSSPRLAAPAPAGPRDLPQLSG